MNAQTCLFDQEYSQGNVIQFPVQKTTVSHNYRKGGEQTVYPIKKKEDLQAVAAWLNENADPKYLLGFVLGINLGLRASELLSLTVSDVMNSDGTIKFVEDYEDTTDRIAVHQKKVHKKRNIYLNQACVDILNWYFSNNFCKGQYLFSSREGGHIRPDTFRKVLKAAAQACGIKQNIGTHTLRKTFGYQHYNQFHDIQHLQRLFGHSSPLITMRYIGVTEEDEKFAYNVMNLDVTSSIF